MKNPLGRAEVYRLDGIDGAQCAPYRTTFCNSKNVILSAAMNLKGYGE